MSTTDCNTQLRVKSYFAATVKEAIEQARAELGSDALLLNSRQAPPEARHLGECEVVFGIRLNVAAKGISAPAGDPVQDLSHRVQEIQEMLSRMENQTQRGVIGGLIEGELSKAGVSQKLAREIEASVWQRLRGKDVVPIGRSAAFPAGSADDLVAETIAELGRRFTVSPVLGRAVALIGPPGTGKTSMLVKLAVTGGLMANRPVRLISIDQERIGAPEQLELYAGILGVPFVLAESVDALTHAVEAAPGGALILIDTPGYTAASFESRGRPFAEFLRARQDFDTHLVLTASTCQAALDRAVDLFKEFRPSKLIFTRLDEADSMGSIFCTAVRAGCPLSFFSGGPSVPQDLESATSARLTENLVRELPSVLKAVA